MNKEYRKSMKQKVDPSTQINIIDKLLIRLTKKKRDYSNY